MPVALGGVNDGHHGRRPGPFGHPGPEERETSGPDTEVLDQLAARNFPLIHCRTPPGEGERCVKDLVLVRPMSIWRRSFPDPVSAASPAVTDAVSPSSAFRRAMYC